jgi:hypothetical protein
LVVNGSYALRFFHFSGINLNDTNRISKHQDRFTLQDRTDLTLLFESYRREVLESGVNDSAEKKYAFGYFSNGVPINQLTRRVYAFSLDKFMGNPFDEKGAFFSFARKNRLLVETDRSGSYNALNFDQRDFRLRWVHACLRLTRFVLGADRYSMLMRYMGHISILLNQRPLFWED